MASFESTLEYLFSQLAILEPIIGSYNNVFHKFGMVRLESWIGAKQGSNLRYGLNLLVL